jgi:excisionase family DNA binding protein
VGKSGEFFTFDEVLKRLHIDETKLKRLVSEGEIRAFREGDQMKFRRADVENLDLTGARSEEETGVIDLSAGKKGDSETLTDDLIFDEGDDLDLSSAEAGMATAEISSQDTFVDENVGMSTEPIKAGDVDDRTEAVAPAAAGKKGAVAAAPARRPARVAVEEPKDTMWAVVMTLSAVTMILAMFVVLGARDLNVPGRSSSDMAKKIADWFYSPK